MVRSLSRRKHGRLLFLSRRGFPRSRFAEF